MLTAASVTFGARYCESSISSQMSERVPSPLGNRAAASRAEYEINNVLTCTRSHFI